LKVSVSVLLDQVKDCDQPVTGSIAWLANPKAPSLFHGLLIAPHAVATLSSLQFALGQDVRKLTQAAGA